MTLALTIAAMLILWKVSSVYTTGCCSSCGKRFVHADDCWRKEDDDA